VKNLAMANSPSGDSAAERFVRVLETFTPTRTAQTASEIGRRARLPSSTAHRIVGELISAGLLERDQGRQVRIGLRLWELTTRSSRALRLRQVALPFMEQVQAAVKEHTQLVVLEQDGALCVERLSAPGAGENITRIAGRLPLHASSSGLVLLANADRELQQRVLAQPLRRLTRATVTDPQALSRLLHGVRRDGYVIASGYVSPVSTGVATPISDATGEVIAALSTILPREADTATALRELKVASRAISDALSQLA
jgi:DNA-binding IclR family transcriptional regulator